MRILAAFICAASLALCLKSQADLISVDDPIFGQGSITRDEESGLEWLDWTITAERSYNDVSQEFGPQGDYPGFRYATREELLALYRHAGIPDVNALEPENVAGNTYSNFDPVSGFLDLFGRETIMGRGHLEHINAVFGEECGGGHLVTGLGRLLEGFVVVDDEEDEVETYLARTAYALIPPHESSVRNVEDHWAHSRGHALVRNWAQNPRNEEAFVKIVELASSDDDTITIKWNADVARLYEVQQSSDLRTWSVVHKAFQQNTPISSFSVRREDSKGSYYRIALVSAGPDSCDYDR